MARHKADGKHITAQGIELIDLVITRVREDPNSIAGYCGDRPLTEPRPLSAEALETLTFPSGKPLPPSLKRWLAFDASWLQELGWFSSLDEPVFTPRRIDEIGWHHDQDLIDPRSRVDGGDAMLEQAPPGKQLQLLRRVPAKPHA